MSEPIKIKVKGIIFEDFVNYKKPSMVIEFPICDFKCDKECGIQVCQNSNLVQEPDIEVDLNSIVQRYLDDPITEAIVCQGLEPFDSWQDLLNFIYFFREYSNDDIVIYTGYNEQEISEKIAILSHYPNIIIKFGRFVPNSHSIFDSVLGVKLASSNQYAKRIP